MTALSLLTTIISPRAASGTVAVTGLSYDGLPLALAFVRNIKTIAYVRCLSKIATFLRSEYLTREALQSSVGVNSTNDPAKLKAADFIIVALPTPAAKAHPPDFGSAVSVSETVDAHTKHGDMVCESTVCGDATSGARDRFPYCGPATAHIP